MLQIGIREPGSDITHFIAMMMAIFATSPLLVKAALNGNHTTILAMAVFMGSMVLLYGASTVYHSLVVRDKILKIFKMGEQEPVEEAIAVFTGQMAKSRMSLQNYRILVMELIAEIFRFGSNNQINMDEVFGNNSDLYNQALQLESTDALGAWLKENCMKMQRQVTNERQDTTKSFVTRAVEYVKEHYADQELSIETICSYLNVSAAYFSTDFKKETGKTFINYLTDYRMEQAVDLLLTKDEKTYIIAEKVGYSDPNYFSYVFKKQFGMSPSKYKAGKLGEK